MSLPDNKARERKKKEATKKVPFEKISKYKRRELKRQISTQSKEWLFVVAKRFNPKICACAVAIFFVLVALICLFGMWVSKCQPVKMAGHFLNPDGWTNAYAINNTLWHVQHTFNGRIPPPQCMSIDEKSENLYFGSYGGFITNINFDREYVMKHRLISRGPLPDADHPFPYMPPGMPVAMQTYGILNFTYVLDQQYGLYTIRNGGGKRHQFVPLNNQSHNFMKAPMDMTHPQFRAELYIVDMSIKWWPNQLMNQILEGTCTGRLIHYDIGSFKTKVILTDLCAPVGVEFLADDKLLAIAEAGKSRIRIIEMNTTNTNSFIKLPGMPHRLSKGQRNNIWITLTGINKNFFDTVNPRPWLRKLLSGLLPDDYLFKMATTPHTALVELGPDLEVLGSLHDYGNLKVENVREVIETKDERLFLSSQTANYLAVL